MSMSKRTLSANSPAWSPLLEITAWVRRLCLLAVAFPLALSASAQKAAEPEADLLDQFKARYQEVREEALAPILELKSGYVERLREELEAVTAEGNLDQVQEVLAEIEWIEGREKVPAETSLPNVLKFRNLYLSALKERERQRIERLEAVAGRSAEMLEAMQRDFTREKKFDRAVATQAFAIEMRDEVERLKAALEMPSVADLKEGETVLWAIGSKADFKTVMGAEARLAGGSWSMTSPPEQRGHLRSPMSLAPPFRISTLVATESGDLRFYYGPETAMEFVLFNWTRNPTTLRMADPSGQQGILSVPDHGFLEVGQSYLIEVEVHERKIEVFVDGELRGSRPVDLARYREPVGIGPFGTVTQPARMIMEHFAVIRMKE